MLIRTARSPNRAAARPVSTARGSPRWPERISTSRQLKARPNAFATASFAAKRPANRSSGQPRPRHSAVSSEVNTRLMNRSLRMARATRSTSMMSMPMPSITSLRSRRWVLGVRYWVLGVGCWERQSNTQYPTPNTQYPIPNTQYPIPNTRIPLRWLPHLVLDDRRDLADDPIQLGLFGTLSHHADDPFRPRSANQDAAVLAQFRFAAADSIPQVRLCPPTATAID